MTKTIIIIGAGIAGLAACNELKKSGFNVLILEGRDHPGGRAYSQEKLGILLGTGANWIHGNDGNPIAELANKFKGNMVSVKPEKFHTFDQKGCEISSGTIKEFDLKFSFYLEEAKKLSFEYNDLSLAESLATVMKVDHFSPVEMDLLDAKLNFFESYIGDSYKFLSTRYWDSEEPWPGDNCFLLSSYQPIIAGLSNECRIKFNEIVTGISVKKDIVEISTDSTIYTADTVVVTVPLGVLKKNIITFDPPLSDIKKNAIKKLGMGLFNITAIKFPFSFWPKEFHAMFFTQFPKPSISTFFNLHHFIKEPILLGFSGGETGRQLENFSDRELIEITMKNFKLNYGNNIPEPLDYTTTRWSHDPFSYGAYSYLKIGSNPGDYDALAQPEHERIFFAGEATCLAHPATTHGAYLSGIREAEKIRNFF